MAKYEYEVEFENEDLNGDAFTPQKKKLIIDATKHSVRIMVKGQNAAIVSFLSDGEVVLYQNNARRAGFHTK